MTSCEMATSAGRPVVAARPLPRAVQLEQSCPMSSDPWQDLPTRPDLSVDRSAGSGVDSTEPARDPKNKDRPRRAVLISLDQARGEISGSSILFCLRPFGHF